jgi:hypothetical protein
VTERQEQALEALRAAAEAGRRGLRHEGPAVRAHPSTSSGAARGSASRAPFGRLGGTAVTTSNDRPSGGGSPAEAAESSRRRARIEAAMAALIEAQDRLHLPPLDQTDDRVGRALSLGRVGDIPAVRCGVLNPEHAQNTPFSRGNGDAVSVGCPFWSQA